MQVRKIVSVAVLSAICGAMLYHLGTGVLIAADDKKESTSVRAARAQLRLAELTLQKAQAMNKNVANTFSAAVMSQFTGNVDFAKAHLQSASKPEGIDAYQATILRAELAARVAEGKLKKANETNQRAPNLVSNLDIERYKLQLEIAQLHLQRGRELASAAPDEKLAWQVEMLTDEVARVKDQTNLLGQNRLSQF